MHALLGGAVRDRVRADYWMGNQTPEDSKRTVARALEKGFRGVKIKCKLEDSIVERLQAILDVAGPDFKVTIDPNQRFYTAAQTIDVARQLEPLGNVEVLEDPIVKTDMEGWAQISAATRIPLALHCGSACDLTTLAEGAMDLKQIDRQVPATHGVIASFPADFFGYFGWPTVARMDDGTLVAAASGLRNAHVCPFGRSVFMRSKDGGKSWTSPTVVNDSPLDDRDTGIVSLGGQRLLLSWFTTDNRQGSEKRLEEEIKDEDVVARWREGLARVTDENAPGWLGSWVRASDNGGETWANPVRVPITTPHGPIRLDDGDLLYFGKEFPTAMEEFQEGMGAVAALTSSDGGQSWRRLGTVPLFPGTTEEIYWEPHVAQLPSGKLVGLIRLSKRGKAFDALGLTHFSLMYSESEDGGQRWSTAEPMGFHGSPPHLLVHSSGALIAVYGRRLEPFGQRAMISQDQGASWEYDYVLRDDGPDHDLGYPSSVELEDGSILAVYYQKPASAADKRALLWTRWRLPS